MPHPFRKIFLISILAYPLLGLIAGVILTTLQPKVYEAKTVLQIQPRSIAIDGPGGNLIRRESEIFLHFIPTEFEVIKASRTLDAVIADLDLNSRWMLDQNAARARLAKSILVQNIKGTDLIEIRVRADSSDEARSIAVSLSETYINRRTKLETQRSEQTLEELRNAVQHQEDLVEDKRKTLTTILRTHELQLHQTQLQNTNDAYFKLQDQIIMLNGQIETLRKYDGDQLLTYASGLDLPENIIRSLHPQYLEATRKLDALKLAGLGDRHPSIKQQGEIVEGMRRDLNEGVIALRETLRAQLELVKDQVVWHTSEASWNGIMFLGPNLKEPTTPENFAEIKAELESAQRILELLKIKLIGEEMQHRISESPIIIHGEAITPESPIYPDLHRNLGIGLLSGLAAGFIITLLSFLFRRQSEAA
ncbi:MAG: hypothetical protein AAGB14_04760 [Verrucomicrobiota bacterium]